MVIILRLEGLSPSSWYYYKGFTRYLSRCKSSVGGQKVAEFILTVGAEKTWQL